MTLIEKLAPYLPYQLTFQTKDKEGLLTRKFLYNIDYSNEILGLYFLKGAFRYDVKISDAKPILRPLSDLFKYVDYNDGNGEVMLGYKFGVAKIIEDGKYLYVDEYDAPQCESPIANVDITAMNLWLFKYHFDVFNMIEDGLAIDINTLK